MRSFLFCSFVIKFHDFASQFLLPNIVRFLVKEWSRYLLRRIFLVMCIFPELSLLASLYLLILFFLDFNLAILLFPLSYLWGFPSLSVLLLFFAYDFWSDTWICGRQLTHFSTALYKISRINANNCFFKGNQKRISATKFKFSYNMVTNLSFLIKWTLGMSI